MRLDWDNEIDVDGETFSIASEYDDIGEPWEWEAQFEANVVSSWTRRSKNPGELILNRDRESYRYFDFALAVKELKKDGTPGKEAARIAREIFDRWEGWCNDRWHYISLFVAPQDENGDPIEDKLASLGGIEDDGNYWKECAEELAREIIEQRKLETQEREFALSLGIRTVN